MTSVKRGQSLFLTSQAFFWEVLLISWFHFWQLWRNLHISPNSQCRCLYRSESGRRHEPGKALWWSSKPSKGLLLHEPLRVIYFQETREPEERTRREREGKRSQGKSREDEPAAEKCRFFYIVTFLFLRALTENTQGRIQEKIWPSVRGPKGRASKGSNGRIVRFGSPKRHFQRPGTGNTNNLTGFREPV